MLKLQKVQTGRENTLALYLCDCSSACNIPCFVDGHIEFYQKAAEQHGYIDASKVSEAAFK